MNGFSIDYDSPLFRPPSEARSLILQVTLGCSWNSCSFCEMYRSKNFRIKDEAELLTEIKSFSEHFPDTRRIFLADGDPFVLPADRLLRVIEAINKHFPKIQRISTYAMPRNLKGKSDTELKALRDAGLSLIYVGIESGDDEVLRRIKKGETAASTVRELLRAKAAGIKSSVIIINGLGGKALSAQHAEGSARVVNAIEPEFLSTLVLSFPTGEQRFREAFGEGFDPLDQRGLFEEMKVLIAATRLKKTVFRSDHASNYLSLKGTLARDKEKLLAQLQSAINQPDSASLRQEWERGL
jgi:radical SAM superfamily enzyme YgiQ (UPF0313 family)